MFFIIILQQSNTKTRIHKYFVTFMMKNFLLQNAYNENNTAIMRGKKGGNIMILSHNIPSCNKRIDL